MGIKKNDLNELDWIMNKTMNAIDAISTMNEADKLHTQEQNKADYAESVKRTNLNNANNLSRRGKVLDAEKTSQEKEINLLLDDLQRYNYNVVEHSKLDEYYKTEEGEKILKDLGVERGENFNYRAKNVLDIDKQLDNTQGLMHVLTGFNDELQGNLNNIRGLQNEILKVKDTAGMEGLIEAEDVFAHMNLPENKDRFFDKEGNMLPLGHAFMTEEKSFQGKTYGFVPKHTAADLAKAGLSTQKETYGKPLIDIKEEDIEINLNANLSLLIAAQKKITAADPNSEFMEDLGLTSFANDVKGAGSLWDKGDQGMLLKNNIENKLIDMMNHATDFNMPRLFGSDTNIKGVKEDYALDSAKENPLKRVAAIEKMHEDYTGDLHVPTENLETGERSTYTYPKTKTSGGLLNEKFGEDGIYFTRGPKPGNKPKDYGDSPESEYFYYLLKTWKNLDTAYPTLRP